MLPTVNRKRMKLALVLDPRRISRGLIKQSRLVVISCLFDLDFRHFMMPESAEYRKLTNYHYQLYSRLPDYYAIIYPQSLTSIIKVPILNPP